MTKNRSIERLENRMQEVDDKSYRYHVLDCCRKFKIGWMDLGQSLLSVYRDKLYLEWGYLSFEKYCRDELGVKNATGLKLLRSYQFLESEEPGFLSKTKEEIEPGSDQKTPSLDSVNLLRLVKKNPRIDEGDYEKIKHKVLDQAREPEEVRKEIRMLSERLKPADPEVERADRRAKFLKGLIAKLEQARLEAMASRFLPPKTIDTIETLARSVEKELNRE